MIEYEGLELDRKPPPYRQRVRALIFRVKGGHGGERVRLRTMLVDPMFEEDFSPRPLTPRILAGAKVLNNIP